jgi:hypothetical protein
MPREDQWVCPSCERPFKRVRQQHVCVPTMSEQEYFADRDPTDREIFRRVERALTASGPVEIEFVSVGILFKTTRTIVELRPRRRGMGLSIVLDEEIPSDRVTRRGRGSNCVASTIPIISADEVDTEVVGWLQQAFDLAEP